MGLQWEQQSAGATTNELCVKVQISIQFRAFQSNINHNEPLELDRQTSTISCQANGTKLCVVNQWRTEIDAGEDADRDR